MEKSARKSNIELARIFCMFLIVAIHYAYYGFIIPEGTPLTANLLLLEVIGSGGHIAVDLFVLISGYFLSVSRFSLRKAAKLYLQVTLISIVINLIAMASGVEMGLREIVYFLFPIPCGTYWFATTYFLLYLLSGYINALIAVMSRRSFLCLIWLLLITVSAMPTFFSLSPLSSNLALFITLYLIAAYFRKYSPRLFEGSRSLALAFGAYAVILAASLAIKVWGGASPLLARLGPDLSVNEDSYTILIAVLLFAGFKNTDMGSSRFINAVAASTFGVYLIHCDLNVLRFLLVTVMKTPDYLSSPYLALHALVTILFVYTVCTLGDIAFRYLIERPLWKLLDRYWPGLEEKLLHPAAEQ